MTSNIYFLGKDGEKSRKRRGKEIVNVRFDLCFGIIWKIKKALNSFVGMNGLLMLGMLNLTVRSDLWIGIILFIVNNF